MLHKVLRKREEIDIDILNVLKNSIVATCECRIKLSNDAEKVKSFYDSFFGNGNAELVSTLQALIDDIMGMPTDDSSPFKTYADILIKLHTAYIKLNDKKVEDHGVIQAVKSLIIAQLKPLAAADWDQEKIEERFRANANDHDAIIRYAIKTLETASLYDSDEKQAFCEKWDITDDESNYSWWKQLVDTYQDEFDDDSGRRYIVGLQHTLGLSYNDNTTSHSRQADAHLQRATPDKGAIPRIIDQAYEEFLNYKFNFTKSFKCGADIKDALGNIDKMFVTIQRNPADKSAMASLFGVINTIELPPLSSGEMIFSKKLKNQIDELKTQLDIFTVSRLYELCEDYMRYYIDINDLEKVDAAVLPSDKCTQLIEKFLEPMINNVIELTIHILTGNPTIFDASFEFENLRNFTNTYFHEKNMERKLRKTVTKMFADMRIADTIVSILMADDGARPLKTALMAALDYYSDTKTSDDEKKAVIIFTGELIKLAQSDFDGVIQETSNFIDGFVEKYRCDIESVRESRYNIILKSGLFAGAAICVDRKDVGYSALTNLFVPKSPETVTVNAIAAKRSDNCAYKTRS